MPYKIFISYSRVNQAHTQWALAFRQDLEDKLKEKTPDGQAEVFLDTREIGPGPLAEHLESALLDIDLLLIVLSHRWLTAPWCHFELAAFVRAAGGKTQARSRIVLVRVEDVKGHRKDLLLGETLWGDFLGGLREYDFFTIDPQRKVTLVYGMPEFPQLRCEYSMTLLELVGDEERPGLASGLEYRPAVGNHEIDDRPKIFLADATPDMNKDRRTLRDYLEERGFCVIPKRSFYHAPQHYERDVRELISNSDLFVQLVGPFRFEATDTFPDGYESWQLGLAKEIKMGACLRWRRPDLLEEDIEEASHREFVFAEDVIACDLKEFKTTLEQKLAQLANTIPIGHDREERRILVNVTNADSEFGETLGAQVEDFAAAAQFNSVSAELVSEQSSLYEVARSNSWHGLVIVYGEGQQEWVLGQMRQARRAVLANKRTSCRIYLRPKEKRPPEPRPVRFKLLRDGAEDELREFLREVTAP
jgi:TIR domain